MKYFIAFAATLLAVSGAYAHPTEDDPDINDLARAHFLANEAVLVEAGETKILFDPLFSTSYGYPLVAPEVEAAILAGAAPFDGIDIVFVSHVHGDHFDASEMNAYLAAQSDIILVAPHQALLDMRVAAGWNEALATRIRVMEFTSQSQEFVLAADSEAEAIHVEALHIPHAGGPGRASIQNMVYRVTLNGEATVMHLGDATQDPAIYDTHNEHFQARTTQHAFPPYWLIGEWGESVTRNRLNADDVTGIHVPIDTPDWMDTHPADFNTVPGETRGIHEHD